MFSEYYFFLFFCFCCPFLPSPLFYVCSMFYVVFFLLVFLSFLFHKIFLFFSFFSFSCFSLNNACRVPKAVAGILPPTGFSLPLGEWFSESKIRSPIFAVNCCTLQSIPPPAQLPSPSASSAVMATSIKWKAKVRERDKHADSKSAGSWCTRRSDVVRASQEDDANPMTSVISLAAPRTQPRPKS